MTSLYGNEGWALYGVEWVPFRTLSWSRASFESVLIGKINTRPPLRERLGGEREGGRDEGERGRERGRKREREKERERERKKEREGEREGVVLLFISFILPHKLLMVPACIHIDQ